MTALSPQVRTKTATEALIGVFGFAEKLGDSGSLLQGTPTVAATPSGLTIATPSINGEALAVDEIAHAEGQAVRVLLSGGTAGTRYTLTCTASTDSGEVMQVLGTLEVE